VAEVLEELFRRGSAVGQVQVGEREVGILGDGAAQELARLVGPQVFRERPALDEIGFGLGGDGADWNFPG
jgi:hypothetical protein